MYSRLVALAALAALVSSVWPLSSLAAGSSRVAGCWEGTWKSKRYRRIGGTLRLTVRFKGRRMVGEVAITGSSMIKGGAVKGRLRGSKLRFGLVVGMGARVDYRGRVVGKRMRGTWRVARIGDFGVWSAKKGCRAAPTPVVAPTAGAPAPLDEKVGVKCVITAFGSGQVSYYFKDGNVRMETTMPMVGSQIQIYRKDGGAWHVVRVPGRGCMATTLPFKPRMIKQMRRRSIRAWRSYRGRAGVYGRPGAVTCTQTRLSRSLFKLPRGCVVRRR